MTSTSSARRHPLTRVLGVLVVSLVAAEVGARIATQVPPDPDHSLYIPHPYVGYTLRPGHMRPEETGFPHRVNALGFRGPDVPADKPADVFRVACLGGSTTWGVGAPDDAHTWPAMVQWILEGEVQRLGLGIRVEVINAGVSGYTLMESLINLKMRVLPLSPDLVIVYHAANDARVLLREGFRPDYTHARRSWRSPGAEHALDPLLDWSRLYAWITREAGRPRSKIHDYVYVEGFDEAPLIDESQMGPGVETYRWTLRELVAIARVHGARVGLTTFSWSPDEALGPEQLAWRGLYTAAMENLNAATADVAADDGTLFVDIREEGPHLGEDFSDFVHFTESGRRRMATAISRMILDAGLLQEPR